MRVCRVAFWRGLTAEKQVRPPRACTSRPVRLSRDASLNLLQHARHEFSAAAKSRAAQTWVPPRRIEPLRVWGNYTGTIFSSENSVRYFSYLWLHLQFGQGTIRIGIGKPRTATIRRAPGPYNLTPMKEVPLEKVLGDSRALRRPDRSSDGGFVDHPKHRFGLDSGRAELHATRAPGARRRRVPGQDP